MSASSTCYELVVLLFSLVWVPGKHDISFGSRAKKSLGTTDNQLHLRDSGRYKVIIKAHLQDKLIEASDHAVGKRAPSSIGFKSGKGCLSSSIAYACQKIIIRTQCETLNF